MTCMRTALTRKQCSLRLHNKDCLMVEYSMDWRLKPILVFWQSVRLRLPVLSVEQGQRQMVSSIYFPVKGCISNMDKHTWFCQRQNQEHKNSCYCNFSNCLHVTLKCKYCDRILRFSFSSRHSPLLFLGLDTCCRAGNYIIAAKHHFHLTSTWQKHQGVKNFGWHAAATE